MTDQLHVLFVEDSEDDLLLLLSRFGDMGYDLVHQRVDSRQDLMAVLGGWQWDLVITDHSMPGFDSLEVIARVRDFDPDVPVIVVSGNIGEETAVAAMKAGAEDYVMKDHLHRLMPAVDRSLREALTRRQHRQALIALQESEARFRAIASNIPGMVFQLLRRAGGALELPYVSAGCQAVLGVQARELQAHPELLLALLLDEDRRGFEQSMQRSAATLSTWNWEGRVGIGEAREVKWVNLRSSPQRLLKGEVQWDGIIANITQNKLAEIEIKRSREELRELSAHIQTFKERERAHIAREIHDDIGGTLTAIKIDVMWIANRIPSDRMDLHGKISAIETLVDRTMETTSRIARDLRPGVLDFGVVAAIEWQAEDFEKRMGIPCRIECPDEEISLEPDLATAIFRIFQETLTNIAKHAHASRVDVKLHATDAVVELEVADNGRGIADEDKLKPRSFGVRGMLERVRALGGDGLIEGEPGKGTRVHVRIPRATGGPPIEIAEYQHALF